MWYFKCALSVASEIYKLWTRLKQQSWGKRCWTIEWRRRQWTASTSRRRVKEKRKSLHTHHISVQLDTRAHLLPPSQKNRWGGTYACWVAAVGWRRRNSLYYVLCQAQFNHRQLTALKFYSSKSKFSVGKLSLFPLLHHHSICARRTS